MPVLALCHSDDKFANELQLVGTLVERGIWIIIALLRFLQIQ
jgi:hypothetical protein